MKLFRNKKKAEIQSKATARVYLANTLSEKKELFVPIKPGIATLYTCGPTVYGPAHIGNLRSYVFSDTLARTLMGAHYHVKRVINITDVGHMVGDSDLGEDKMNVGAKRDHTTPEAIAEKYTRQFLNDISDLNINTDEIIFPRATQYIREQIALAKTLEEKGFTYETDEGLVFDTSRFSAYGELGHVNLAAQKAGARIELDPEKKHPSDFLLWRRAKPNDLQKWDSPWGLGNPGWHLECSTMSRALLGTEIDIHTGGEDHIQVHHNNEIAQSEAASGRTFVHYWMHNAFLSLQGEKISKSLHNEIYLSTLIDKGFHPLSLRYFFLQAHYRTPLSFSYDALQSAESALKRLWRLAAQIAEESKRRSAAGETRTQFLSTLRDDLQTAQALGILWETLKSEEYTPEEKWGLLEDADSHLGLKITTQPNDIESLDLSTVPESIAQMVNERTRARKNGDYEKADALRQALLESGYRVEDSEKGPLLSKK